MYDRRQPKTYFVLYHNILNFIYVTFCLLTIVIIDHFTVICSVAWPLNGSEAGVDVVFIQTSLLLCKSSCFNTN